MTHVIALGLGMHTLYDDLNDAGAVVVMLIKSRVVNVSCAERKVSRLVRLPHFDWLVRIVGEYRLLPPYLYVLRLAREWWRGNTFVDSWRLSICASIVNSDACQNYYFKFIFR